MNEFRTATIFAALLVLTAGCGRNNITEGEAQEGWSVASAPLQEGQQKIQKKVEELGAEIVFREEPVVATADCETAGDVKLALAVSIDGDAGSAADPAVDFDADYRSCRAQESTVHGVLQIDPPANVGPEQPGGGSSGDAGMADVSDSEKPPNAIGYEGTLHFGGDIDGPCDVDMLVIPSEAGQPSYSGTWCGYDADDVLGFSFGG